MKLKLESRLLGKMSVTADRQMTPNLWAESEELKSLLMKVKEENDKAGLKLNIKKTKIVASGSITSWQVEEEKSGSNDRFYFLGLQKSLQTMTVATKLKDTCYSEEKL